MEKSAFEVTPWYVLVRKHFDRRKNMGEAAAGRVEEDAIEIAPWYILVFAQIWS